MLTVNEVSCMIIKNNIIFVLLLVNLDFIKNLNDMYVFSNSTPRRECILISIVDDEFVEANETFSVRLIAGASADFVTFTRQEAAVIIEDDDCK